MIKGGDCALALWEYSEVTVAQTFSVSSLVPCCGSTSESITGCAEHRP